MNHKYIDNEFFVFFILALLLNIDRLVMGEYGLVRQLDTSNMYLNKMMFISNYWVNPEEYGWNSSILRGWPTEIGSISPQYFGVFIAYVFPIKYVFPILHVIVDFLVFYGAYIFTKYFLGYGKETAIFGAFVFLGINYWHNENLLVTAAPLLLLLVTATGVCKGYISPIIRFVLMLLVLILSFPPYVLPIMPIAHVVLIVMFSDRSNIRQNIFNCFIFWSIFTIFYGVSIIGYLDNYTLTNRVIWENKGVDTSYFDAIVSHANKNILFPALILLVLVGRETVRIVLYVAILVFTMILITSVNQSELLLEYFPLIGKYSFFLGRAYNFVGIAIFLGVVVLLEKIFTKEIVFDKKKFLSYGFLVLLFTSLYIFITYEYVTLVLYIVCTSTIFVSLFFYDKLTPNNKIVQIAVLFFMLLPFRLTYSLKNELPYQGYLFTDKFNYETNMKAFRVATIMEEPWQQDFFSAQVSIKGLETFGGMSVFYHVNDAKLWQSFIAQGSPSWDKIGYTFQNWNNRLELIRGDYLTKPDNILQLMKINNVLFVRSQSLIDDPELLLIDHKSMSIDTKRTWFFGSAPDIQQHYLYKIKNPVSRIFVYKEKEVNKLAGVDLYESIVNEASNKLNHVNITKYSPGSIEFEGDFSLGDNILISNNYSQDWKLYINKMPSQEFINNGPLGMIQIDAKDGKNVYELKFNNNNYKFLVILSLLGIVGLAVFSRVVQRSDVKSR